MGRDQGPTVLSSANLLVYNRKRTPLYKLTHAPALSPRLTSYRNPQIPVWVSDQREKSQDGAVTVQQCVRSKPRQQQMPGKYLKETNVTEEIHFS